MMQPKAIILDLDGVLTNTAHYHFLAWKQLADELGYHFTEKDNERLKGVDRISSFEIILEINGVMDQYDAEKKALYANKKNDYYKELIEQMTSADILENIPEFLAEARNRGIKLAVASISKNAGRVLELLGITPLFDYIADAAAITRPKPEPEIFEVCARSLGFEPEECIGVEDAQAGIQSIHAAGMFSVGIGVDVTCLEPDMPLKSTAELDLDKICAAFTQYKEA